MRKQTKPKSTRIVEIGLVLFICSFIYRAIPNVNVIPDLPWADDLTNNDLGSTDDKDWGNYARMQWTATHPSAPTPTLEQVQPEKFWLQRPRGIPV